MVLKNGKRDKYGPKQYIYLFKFIFGCTGFWFLCTGFLQLQQARATLSLWCMSFSLQWFLLLQSTSSRCRGFSSCNMQAQQLRLEGCRAMTQQLRHRGLVAPRHEKSSQTGYRTHVPWVGCCCCPVTQSCPALCDLVDCSPSGSFVHGLLQARILGWVAMPFFMGFPRPRDQTWVSYIALAGRFLSTIPPGKSSF